MNSVTSVDTIAYHLSNIGSKQIFTKTGSYKVINSNRFLQQWFLSPTRIDNDERFLCCCDRVSVISFSLVSNKMCEYNVETAGVRSYPAWLGGYVS